MYVLDPSFASLAHFAQGIGWVSGELRGADFGLWLCDRYGLDRGGLPWLTLIADRVGLDYGHGYRLVQARDVERESAACEELLDRLDEYLGVESSGGSSQSM